MAAFLYTFVVFTYFILISGYILTGDDDHEIVWPTEYHFHGEKIDFSTTLKSPFEIWYSGEQNRSRVDFYGGSSRKYYYGDEGVVYTVFPTTDPDLNSEMVCTSKATEDEQKDFLPDVSSFTYTGESKILFDKLVHIWTSTEEFQETMIKEQTLYVYRTEYGFDIPIQYVTKAYNLEVGNVVATFIINYYNFKDSVSEEDLKVEIFFCVDMGKLGNDFKSDIHMLHPDVPQEVDIAYNSYSQHHNKKYKEKETQIRKNIFEDNWRMVHEHNRKNIGFKLELNQFSDMTEEELSSLTGTFVSEHRAPEVHAFPHTLAEIEDLAKKLPKSYDLRIEGFVTSVKNQGACGSCWAFSTTAAVEGALAKKNGGRLLDLSEQSLVDCAWVYENSGCKGGTVDGALKYVYANGVPTEEDYGLYIEHDGYCEILNMTNVYNIKGFGEVTPRNPNALKVALHKYGPVTVAIHAGQQMIHYSSGIFYDFSCAESHPNHGVTVVGYGNRDGEDYWIVKNSWGESWGEDGYILMSAKNNNCFVLETPYYAIV